MAQTDQHINTAETVLTQEQQRKNAAPLGTNAQIADTEVKTPACTIVYGAKTHPFETGRTLVFARGSWSDGLYGRFPVGKNGKGLTQPDDKATNAPGGDIRAFRLAGCYFTSAGSWRAGYVIDVPDQHVDNVLAWLGQVKFWCESAHKQVSKAEGEGKAKGPSKAKVVMPAYGE